MKNAFFALVMLMSAQAFGSVDLDLNNKNLSRDLTVYLAKRLSVCSQGVAGEKFTVDSVQATFDVIDNGIVDHYYTIAIGYSVNNENLGAIEVKMIDKDINYQTMEQKVSFEISQDHTNLCK